MRRRWVLAAGAAGLLAVVAGLSLLSLDPGVREQKLQDGSVMVLRGVTYGRFHKLGVGNIFQRVGGRLLPEPLSRRLGITVLSHSNSLPELVVWVDHVYLTDRTRRPPGGYTATPAIISDDAGTEFEQVGSAVSRQSTNSLAGGYIFGAFPRASRQLTIRVRPFNYLEKNFYEALFRFPNPAFLRRTRTPPTVYPVSVDQEELSIKLKAFSSCLRPNRGGGHGTETWMNTTYAILDKTNPTNDWCVRGVSVRDDYGCVYGPSATSADGESARTSFSFRGGLSTNEAWTLRFTLSRFSYAPYELVTFTNVAISGRSERPFAITSAQVQGVTLTVTEFRKNGYVFVSLSPPHQEGLPLELVRVVDDQGRPVRVTVTGRAARSDDYHFGLELASDAKSADLTFAVRRDRYLEIKARPVSAPR